MSKPRIQELFQSILDHRAHPGFQSEVLTYLTLRFLHIREKEFIKQVFNILDEEKDGELDFEELVSAFKTHFGLETTQRKWSAVC